jgi:phosphoglycolate phosphatase-like HAD superfamily hydrolase
MSPAVIFDLDQTLVDTSHFEILRMERKWNVITQNIHTTIVYESINEIFSYLRSKEIIIIIITTSPSNYCRSIINHFKWQVDGSICYHDVAPHIKPHPAAFLKAIRDFKLDVTKTISAGDRDIDVIASKKANILSIGCVWGTKEKSKLIDSNPAFLAETPSEMMKILKDFFK